MTGMETRRRYCRWHEAPEVRKARRGWRLLPWRRRSAREGRKRITPGMSNVVLGAGWEEAKTR